MVEQPAAGGQQPVQAGGVRQVLGGADVLGHADAGDGVEGAVRDLAVVLQADLDPVGETGVGDPAAGQGDLLRRDGDADRVHAVVLGGVQQQRAPAAADVQQPHAGPQAQLAADQVELGRLGVLQAPALRRPVRAGVHHRGAEHEAVEVVADVVVVADRRAVAAAAVQPAPDGARLLGGRRGLQPQDAGLHRGAQQPPAPGADRVGDAEVQPADLGALGEVRDGREHLVEVGVGGDFEVAGDVGPGEAELARLPDQPTGGPPVAQHQGGGAGRPGQAAVPGLDPQRDPRPEQGLQGPDHLPCELSHRAPPSTAVQPYLPAPLVRSNAVPS